MYPKNYKPTYTNCNFMRMSLVILLHNFKHKEYKTNPHLGLAFLDVKAPHSDKLK